MMKETPVRTVPVADDPSHRVRPEFKGKLATVPSDGATTIYEMAQISFSQFSKSTCMNTREFLGMKSPKIKEFGPNLRSITYEEAGVKAHKFGAALRASGCVAAPDTTNLDQVKTPCRMAIFENTCPEWIISCIGAFTQSVSVTTVYATLGIDAVVEAINDNLIPVIVCNKINVANLVSKAKDMPTLKTIVYTNDLVSPDMKIDMPAAPKGVTIISFDEYVKSGDTTKYPVVPPKPDTTAVVMYTSGSTGKPKGVVITHRSVIGAAASAEYILGLGPQDKYLAYLPLAHIMELMLEFVVLANGCSLNFADPKSLTATGSFPIGALELYCPTVMVAVPKIWDTIKKVRYWFLSILLWQFSLGLSAFSSKKQIISVIIILIIIFLFFYHHRVCWQRWLNRVPLRKFWLTPHCSGVRLPSSMDWIPHSSMLSSSKSSRRLLVATSDGLCPEAVH